MDIPAIIVSGPSTPHEYRTYLAAMNLGALDFLAYPYQQIDFERMLESAIAAHSRAMRDLDSESGHDLRQRGAA